jgi:hypothetical protein
MWRHPRLTARASRSAISALTRASISPAARRRRAGESQSRARPRRARRRSTRPGRSSRNPGCCTRSMSACAPDADTRSASSRARAKLAVLLWCLLSRSEDYAHQQPSLTAKKLRLLEIRAGTKTLMGTNTGLSATRQRMRKAERGSPNRPRPPTSERSQTGKQRRRRRRARARHRGAHRSRPLRGKVARQAHERQTPALRHVIGSRPDAAQRRPPASTDVDGDPACANTATTGRSPPAAKPSSQETISGPARALRDRPHPRKVAAAPSTCIGRPTQERAPAR